MVQAQRPIPLDIANVLFSGPNTQKMVKIMESPMRRLFQLQMSQFETIMSSFMAGQGEIQPMIDALMYGFLDHIQDPMRVFEIFMQADLYHK